MDPKDPGEKRPRLEIILGNSDEITRENDLRTVRVAVDSGEDW